MHERARATGSPGWDCPVSRIATRTSSRAACVSASRLAQSLINGPRILLMDEPFSALDVQTRSLMENELLALWAASSTSVVFVTHDLEEAISLSDRVFVITAGPGTVKSTYKVDLPRPRNVAEIRFQPRFAEIYEEIWKDLKDEVLVSYERQKRSGAA